MRTNLNRDFYHQILGLGGLIGAANIFISTGPDQLPRVGTAIGIALIILADAHTWSNKDIPAPRLLSLSNLLDCLGVMAALVALAATGLVDSDKFDLKKSIGAALVYILACLAYWSTLPKARFESIKKVMSLTDRKRWIFVGLFVVSALVLVLVLLCPMTRQDGWLPYMLAVLTYLGIYFLLVTLPLLRHEDSQPEVRG